METRGSTFSGGNPFYDWLANRYEHRLLERKSTIRNIPLCLQVRPQYGYVLNIFALRAARGTSKKCLKDTILYLEQLARMLELHYLLGAGDYVDAAYIKLLYRLAEEYTIQLIFY